MRKAIPKAQSLLIVSIVYSVSIGAAFIAFHFTRHLGVLWAVFIADVAATIIVWAAGLIYHNASMYDPYWSVAPMVVIPFWMALRGSTLSMVDLMLLVAVFYWGVRLTLNWSSGWRGFVHCDWRYDMLRDKNPNLWFITNLGGINMMPTVLVYLGMIPAYYLIQSRAQISIYTIAGFAVCVGAASLQLISDTQMRRFKADTNGQNIDTGLWRYSRHPNYFGEVSFWWGIFIMTLGLEGGLMWRVSGAVLITALFVFISVPMMERHVEDKIPNYTEYKSRVSMLIPWKRKNI